MNDSVKFNVIVDSGIETFLVDRDFITNNEVWIVDANDPDWIVAKISSVFNLDGIRVFRTIVDRNSSPLLFDQRMMVQAVDINQITPPDSFNTKGLLPLKAFAKNGIINLNLKNKYLLPLDTI